jgi:hypothetical protein
MRSDRSKLPPGWRRLLHAVIAAIGVTTIVGSGGGFPDLHFDFSGPLAPIAWIVPSRVTVQVGATVEFVVNASGTLPFSYQWQRDGVDIAGATGDTYALVGANLADDGAQFSVRVTNSVGVDAASSLLQVSSLPAIVYQDGDFAVTDWVVTAFADPLQDGPTHAEAQVATGGNPGAYRSITTQMPPGPSAIRAFHAALSSTYDPAAQGAIYSIDFALDCNRLSTTTTSETYASPMFEQGGRWFATPFRGVVCAPVWLTGRGSSLHAEQFTLAAGPACVASQACPDFSASAAPLRFGFVSGVNLATGAAAGIVSTGVDNWTVTVWRK